MLRTKEQCIEDLRKYGLGDYQYKAAQAELEILMAEESLSLLQKTRENLHEVLAEMNSQIKRFREVVDQAAADASTTSRLLVCWTKVLAITTAVLALATVALVFATIKGHL